MGNLINTIEAWPIILQGALGSALFAFSLWLIKFSYIRITNLSDNLREKREVDELKRYYIYKYYTNSTGLFYFSQGYLLVIYMALKGIISAILIAIFWFLINRIIGASLFFDIFFAGILIYIMTDLIKWFHPRLSKGCIENYDEDTVNRVREALLDETLIERDVKQRIRNKENEQEKLIDELSALKEQLLGETNSGEKK